MFHLMESINLLWYKLNNKINKGLIHNNIPILLHIKKTILYYHVIRPKMINRIHTTRININKNLKN